MLPYVHSSFFLLLFSSVQISVLHIIRLSRCASVFICMNVSIMQMDYCGENRLRQQKRKKQKEREIYIELDNHFLVVVFSFFFRIDLVIDQNNDMTVIEPDSFHKKSFF